LRPNYLGFTEGGGGIVREGRAPLDGAAPDAGSVFDGGVEAAGTVSFGTVYVVGV
jgi:hypothetical protein